ncbi:MAG: hypothetical protein B7W98_00800 [Parcubacteria group bacterium 20-58-5]|nr:MAG: hypothetical protein B7W98_00800 [Parcubacteria group bacterium 20-58-5]
MCFSLFFGFTLVVAKRKPMYTSMRMTATVPTRVTRERMLATALMGTPYGPVNCTGWASRVFPVVAALVA